MPFIFLLFMAVATGALSAYAGRDEIRHSGEAVWRAESFLAYALFFGLVLLPALVYFYVFYGDWFLLYWVDTGRAPWLWGVVSVFLLTVASIAGFSVGVALCRASRDLAARRFGLGAALLGIGVWPLGWERLSVVGTHRQFDRDYGLAAYFASPAFYAGLAILVVLVAAFSIVAIRIDRQTRDII